MTFLAPVTSGTIDQILVLWEVNVVKVHYLFHVLVRTFLTSMTKLNIDFIFPPCIICFLNTPTTVAQKVYHPGKNMKELTWIPPKTKILVPLVPLVLKVKSWHANDIPIGAIIVLYVAESNPVELLLLPHWNVEAKLAPSCFPEKRRRSQYHSCVSFLNSILKRKNIFQLEFIQIKTHVGKENTQKSKERLLGREISKTFQLYKPVCRHTNNSYDLR